MLLLQLLAGDELVDLSSSVAFVHLVQCTRRYEGTKYTVKVSSNYVGYIIATAALASDGMMLGDL